MRILLTGAQGQLGTALQQALTGHDLILKDLPAFELTDSSCESQIIEARPDAIIHAGAYTNVDGAEREPERARAVNVLGTERVARAAERLKCRLIYVSTDYVFDGLRSVPYGEGDATNPINAYGRSKQGGEVAALELSANTLVVRTAWLYGHGGANFVKTIMKYAMEKSHLDVVADQRGCPTFAGDLAEAIRDLLAIDLRGICHVTNTGDCTWHEFAEAIVRLAGSSAEVRPITTQQAGRLARRPAYSVLGNDKLRSVRPLLPHWRSALERYVRRTAPAASIAGAL
jgi:dTDP-4-dehydrorhamnose reductase